RLNALLADMMAGYSEYEVGLEEIHHTEKKDAPSGTAITLAQGVMQHLRHKTNWVNRASNARHELPILSLREDNVPGTHTVVYRSEIDTLEIKHTAHSRQGFALGAVLVAEWIPGRQGVLGMDDFLPFKIKE
ncbi:MAG: 4-hydroxy-tetrahydrodipicolinate reductase, partial [Cytophagales bacterium]|nr:4-hydroxy-tetrahydrodipicolinate reductase [Cytophagales bacterium]